MNLNKKNIIVIIGAVVIFVLLFILISLLVNQEEPVSDDNDDEEVEVVFGEDIVDVDGNSYRTVEVGGQVWMAENLNTVSEYGNSWCYSDQEFYCDRYGRLYSWEAAMAGELEPGSQGICPNGWYLPTDEDWYALESFFATARCDAHRLSWGCSPAGQMMKTETWGGVEDSALAVLPAGYINRQGGSSLLGSYSYFWTSTKIGDGVWRRGFLDAQSGILRTTENPEYGYSVRCIKK